MNRIDLILLAQAFASPTDMASSGVQENVFLATTPTLDGVCGIQGQGGAWPLQIN